MKPATSEMEMLVALLVISVTFVVIFLKYKQAYWRRRGIPHEEPHFPLGNLKGWRSTKHLIDLFTPIYRKFKGTGPFAGFYFLVKPVAFALDLKFVQQVLIKDFHIFDERGAFHNGRDDPLSANLFALDGPAWRPLRQKVSPTFTSGKMKFMFPTVLRVGKEFERVFAEKVASSAEQGVLEVTDLLGRFTADVIGECAFGLECNSLSNPQAEFVQMGRRMLVERRHNQFVDSLIESFPKLAARLHMRQIAQPIHDFYMGITRATVEFREKNNIKRPDFMNLLIEMKNGKDAISLNEIAAQAFIFFVAGFETSATAMGFALFELARNEPIQDRLRAEINEVFQRHGNEFSYECMQDQHYLNRVIKETLRKYPIASSLLRQANRRCETSDPKYYIEKGTSVIIPVYGIHHDPEIYPEPEKFDPDRFTEEEIRKRPACTWLPFGDGPRNCIGLRFGTMQACIGLSILIRNFKFTACSQTPKRVDFLKKNPLLSAADGIKLRVTKI